VDENEVERPVADDLVGDPHVAAACVRDVDLAPRVDARVALRRRGCDGARLRGVGQFERRILT
jgi:hypothetical protein